MRFALPSLLASVALLALSACSSRDAAPDDGGTDLGRPDGGLADIGTGGDGDVDAGGSDAGVDGGPDCTGMATCTTSGITCDGDTRVICGRNAAGCLVENRTDCTAVAGGTCSTMGGAHCTVDPCIGIPTSCPMADRTCTGDTLVTCAADSVGCLVTTSVDCTSIGATCLPMPPDGDGGIGPAACSAPAPCFGVDPATFCTTEGRTCPTTTRLADCHMNATGCLVETDTTCSGSPLAHCDDTGTTPTCVDPCMGLTLCADTDPAARCVGARIVTCTHDAAGCYVRTESNCGTMGMGCDASSGTPICSGALCPSMAGTLSCTGRSLPYTQAGDTSTESSVLPRNSCFPGVTYLGNEGIWTFTSDVAAVAHVTVHPISDTTHTFDVMVLDGTASPCDTSSTCTTSDSSGSVGARNVDFVVLPGQRYYLVYDGVDPTATTTYSILVDCDLCGDGIVSPPEQCDDANLTDGDGCSSTCQPELGWACSGMPSTCHRIVCGNSVMEVGESCDDGNTAGGDGCDPFCRVEVPTGSAMRTIMSMLLSSDPTYSRDDAPCDSTFPTSDVHYRTFTIVNPTAAPVSISIDVLWTTGDDGYLFAYSTFNPALPGSSCIDGNDDGLLGTDDSFLSGVTVPAGGTIVLVTTEFVPGSAIDPFTIGITSP